MSKPTVEARKLIKKVARYLVGAPRLVWKFGEIEGEPMIDVEVDADWAGALDRTSTSGGLIKVGGAGIKHWSRTQRAKALSSGEAEYYALVTGAAEALGVQALAAELGWTMSVRLWTDSTASISVASRRGLGKLRHVELRLLWLQDALKEGRLKIMKVPGLLNVADHLTKTKALEEFKEISEKAGAVVKGVDEV